MNFLDAVQALKDGKCNEIINGSGYTVIKKGTLLFVKESSSMFKPNISAIFCDWQLVDPIPQTETVEVKRWGIIAPSGFCEGTNSSYDIAVEKATDYGPGYSVIELTGTFTRPVPAKVKRREVFNNAYVEGCGVLRVEKEDQARYLSLPNQAAGTWIFETEEAPCDTNT